MTIAHCAGAIQQKTGHAGVTSPALEVDGMEQAAYIATLPASPMSVLMPVVAVTSIFSPATSLFGPFQ